MQDTTADRMVKSALTLKLIEAQRGRDPEWCRELERHIIDSELETLAKESEK